MLVYVGNRGFSLGALQSWEYEPEAAVLRLLAGGRELVFQDEEAAEVVALLRRHAKAAESGLQAIEEIARDSDHVAEPGGRHG